MNKYLVICYEEWENGKRILPRIETTIAAKDFEQAKKIAFKKYKEYHEIGVWEWNYRWGGRYVET